MAAVSELVGVMNKGLRLVLRALCTERLKMMGFRFNALLLAL